MVRLVMKFCTTLYRVMLRRSIAMHGKMCKLLQLVVETMAMPFNISRSISWGKKSVGPLLHSSKLRYCKGIFASYWGSVYFKPFYRSVSKPETPIFLMCSSFPFFLYFQHLPTFSDGCPSGFAQALIVTRTCTDGTFANDVALGCAGVGLQAAQVMSMAKIWEHMKNIQENMGKSVSKCGNFWDDQLITRYGNSPVFETHARNMGLEDDVLIGHGHQFNFVESSIDTSPISLFPPKSICMSQRGPSSCV